MDWICSDWHLWHENIIKYCRRPFRNADHMNKVILDRVYERVKPGDVLYNVGDVGYCKGSKEGDITPDDRMSIVKGIPCTKVLILGNHDKSQQRMRELGWDVVCESMVVRCFNRILFLNHRPLPTRPTYHGNGAPSEQIDYIVHGHIHNSTPEERAPYKSKGEMIEIPSFNINMSAEMWNYDLWPLETVIKRKIANEKHGTPLYVTK